MNYWRANQDALIAVGVGPENADLMDPRDATYDHRDYTVAEAQEMAVWAVRLSPYDVPDDLEAVLRRFGEKIRPRFDAQDMAEMTWSEVEVTLRAHLFTDPCFMAWNERKNGRQGAGFASRYGSSAAGPDDDFIDLDALIRNTSVSLFRELDADAAFNDEFRRQWRETHGTDGDCENCPHE